MHAQSFTRTLLAGGRKNADPDEPDPLLGSATLSYLEEGPLVPLGEVVGHGVPFGEVPAEFPWLFPEVDGDEPEFDEPEFDEPELGDPALGAEEPEVPAVPGAVAQGDPLGLDPGVFGLFGLVGDGCALPPELDGFVGLDPGILDGEPGVAAPVGGVVAPVGGGAGVLVGGVAAPGDCVCLAPELPAGADRPADPLCATTQVAQKRSTDRKASFFSNIGKPLRICDSASTDAASFWNTFSK